MTAAQELADIYAQVPSVACKGLCATTCTIIPVARAERAAIEAHTGRRLRVISGERVTMMRPTEECACPHLKRGRCRIYAVRPIICRLYGAAEGLMLCPHGCRPIGPLLTGEQAGDLIRAVQVLR